MTGTLIPREAAVRFSYITGVFYRSTLYLLFLFVAAGSISGYLWFKHSEMVDLLRQRQATIKSSIVDLSSRKEKLSSIIEQYNYLVSIYPFRRVPFAPVLAAVSTSISPECSLTALLWSVAPDQKTAAKRHAELQMSVFVSDAAGTISDALAWLNVFRSELEKDGIVSSQPRFASPEQTAGGRIVDVAITLDLAEGAPVILQKR